MSLHGDERVTIVCTCNYITPRELCMSIFHAQVISQTECLPVYLRTNITMNFDEKIMPATVKLKKEPTTFTFYSIKFEIHVHE